MKHEYTISATQGHKIYQKHLVTNEQEELLFQVIGVYSLWSTEIGIRGHWREPRDATFMATVILYSHEGWEEVEMQCLVHLEKLIHISNNSIDLIYLVL